MKKVIALAVMIMGASTAYANGSAQGQCKQMMGPKGYTATLETDEGCRGNFFNFTFDIVYPDKSLHSVVCDAGNFASITCAEQVTGAEIPVQTTDGGGSDGVSRTVSILYSSTSGAASLFECDVPNY